MRAIRFAAAFLMLLSTAHADEQASYVWPTAPVVGPAGSNSLGSLTANYYNPALRALASCSAGATAPANGPSSAPLQYQCWMDTSASPIIHLRYWDGSQWPVLATLDASSHAWVFSSASPIRAVTGTSDTILDADRAKLIDVKSSSSVAQTLPQAGVGGAFAAGWYVTIANSGTANVTLTPDTSTIDGAASMVIRPGQSATIRSTGSNYISTLLQQPENANLWGLSGLSTAADKCVYWTGAGTPALMDCKAWSRAMTSAPDAAAGRDALGVVIGSDVQAFNANLAALAGLSGASGKLMYFTAAATLAMADTTSYGRSVLNTADAAALRTVAGSVIGTDVQAWDSDLDAFALKTAPVGDVVGTTDAQAVTNKTFDCASNICTVRLGSDVTGTLLAANFPALTGDVTTTAGSLATSIGAGKVTSAMLNGDVYSTAHIWSGAQSFSGPADLKSAVLLTGAISPSQITGNQNNYTPTGFSTANVMRLSSDAARDITGLAGGADGRTVIVHNVGAFAISLINESGSSTAGNRFLLGGDIVLLPDTSITLRYDGTSSRWRAISTPGAGGGGGGGVSGVTIAAGDGIRVDGTCNITTSGTCTVSQSDVERVNNGLDRIYQSKLLAVPRRVINAWATGFKAATDTDRGINGGASSNVDTSNAAANGYVLPTTSAGVAIADGTGTAIGNMTSSGGLSAAFSGSNSKDYDTSAATSLGGGNGYVGKNYSGAPQAIGQATVYATNNLGFDGTGTATTITITLYGKQTAPSSATDGTVLGTTVEFSDASSLTKTITSSDAVTQWNYLWVYVETTQTSSKTAAVARLYFISPPSSNSMTLATSSQTTDSSVSNARALIEFNNLSAPTLNTDLTAEVTCDGGTNWAAATLSAFTAYSQGGRTVAETADTSCTSGTSFAARIKTANGKSVPVYGVSVTAH